MRALLVIIVVLAALWSGYWFVGATAVERGADILLDDLRARGWQVEVSDVGTSGFPNRFDTTATEVSLADPRSGIGWTAPFFQVLALSYKPNHVIAALPNTQTIAFPEQTLTIDSTGMLASLVVDPGTALTLDRTTFVADTARIVSDMGWQVALRDGRFATRKTGSAGVHEVGIFARDIALPKPLRATLDPSRAFPAALDSVRLDATLTFDRDFDRISMSDGPSPDIREIELREVSLNWGPVSINAEGNLLIGADGYPEGQIMLRSHQWQRVAKMIVGPGLIAPEFAETVNALFKTLAEADGSRDVLEAPLVFRDGSMSFGFLPLGPAPRF